MGNVYCKNCGINREYYPKKYDRKSCLVINNLQTNTYKYHYWTSISNEINIFNKCLK